MTRTILITLATLFVFNCANSQITKGNWMLSGNINFSSTDYNSEASSKNHYFELSVYPHIGYFLADNFAIGLNTNVNYYGRKAINTDVYDSYTDFNMGPFARFYLLSTTNRINILTEGNYMYGFVGSGQSKQKTSKNTFAFAAGPAIYFNETAGLEFLIGYSSYKYVGYEGRNNTIQIGLGLEINLEKEK